MERSVKRSAERRWKGGEIKERRSKAVNGHKERQCKVNNDLHKERAVERSVERSGEKRWKGGERSRKGGERSQGKA